MNLKGIIKKLLPLGIAAMCAFSGAAQENWDNSTAGQLTYSNGNVGIGTETPQATLDVAGGISSQAYVFRDPSTGAAYKDGWIGMANNIGDGKNWFHLGGITDTDNIRRTAYASAIHYFFGNIGIGTLEPDARLDVNGNFRADTIILNGENVGWRNQLRFESAEKRLQHLFYQDAANGNRLVLNLDYFNEEDVSDSFYLGGELMVSDKAIVHGSVDLVAGHNGIVHIGAQNSYGEGAEVVMMGSNGGSAYRFDNVNDLARIFWGDDKDHQFQVFNHGSGVTSMYLEGNMGIGTTNPQAKLDIQGNGGQGALIRTTNLEVGKTWQFGATSADFFTIAQPGVGDWLIIQQDTGNIGLGTYTPDYKLDVNGKIRAKEIIVETGWADYVFEEDYDLAPLPEVKDFIEENGHLPNIPSAEEISENGLSVAEMNTKMMEKIEELTLYIIDLEERINELEAE